MRQLHARLLSENQQLVWINDRTRWEHHAVVLEGPVPQRGYALTGRSVFRKRAKNHAYVTDVNHDDNWYELYAVFDSLGTACDHLLRREA
jgi:hypothetical protein